MSKGDNNARAYGKPTILRQAVSLLHSPFCSHTSIYTIKGCKKIIDINAEIGIQADSIVNKNINCRHHNTCQPQINARPIF